MSDDAGRLRGDVLGSDVSLIVGVMLGLYALFTLFGILLGLDFAGIVSTLRGITFFTAVYALVALALNLQWGYAGLFNIGVAGFMAVGVYTMSMLTAPVDPGAGGVPGLGLPLPIGIVGGMAAAALVGGVAALPALRLKADYLAIVTLAFGEIIRITYNSEAFQNFTVFGYEMGTGASRGIPAPPNPVRGLYYTDPSNPSGGTTALGETVFGGLSVIGIDEPLVVNLTYTLVLVGFVALFFVLSMRIASSPFGRVLKAIREDELVARSMGKNTQRFKVKIFMLGCALMGLSGILWQGSQSLVTPTQFTPLLTFYVFIALMIGGAGSTTGSVIGAGLFAGLLFQGPVFVSRLARNAVELDSAPNTFPDAVAALGSLDVQPLFAYSVGEIETLRFVLVGVILIYLVHARPTGLLGHRKEVATGFDHSKHLPRESDRSDIDAAPGETARPSGGEDTRPGSEKR